MLKKYRIFKIVVGSWMARKSRCLSLRWGYIGINGAILISGPNKGMQVGAVRAIQAIKEQ